MTSSTKGGIVAAIAVLGILTASVVATRLWNQSSKGTATVSPGKVASPLAHSPQNASIAANKRKTAPPPPVVTGPPYYIQLNLEGSFTQELYFLADGKQQVGYQKEGTEWLIEVEARRRSATTVQVQMNARRFRKQGTPKERFVSVGLGTVLTTDAPPFASKEWRQKLDPKIRAVYDKNPALQYSILVQSKPAIAVFPQPIAAR